MERLNPCVFLTEEYEAHVKKQEAVFRTEVTATVQEPKPGDLPPMVVSTMEPMATSVISGQVGASRATSGRRAHLMAQISCYYNSSELTACILNQM